uniref:Protein kinase domain-containing protein n=1 Tax=Thermosporothrix sp. COM3 TaxID=2490863 RepID=A0A455SJX8_9CHLR|nr:hypothetical protein KTC_26710 [Thermosporothrix sp. COM3]
MNGQSDFFSGRQIGNYRIIAPLAQGGFGMVYQGQHIYLTRRVVAIKIMRQTLGESEQAQFLREAELLERLQHPHILTVLDAGFFQGQPYMITPLMTGGSLRQRLKHPLSPTQALQYIRQIGQALYYAHQQKMIHRDLKPENIFLADEETALLADFGIASLLSTQSYVATSIAGTPAYMAPEQFRGEVSPQSDQYALACILYELLTGRKVFEATDFISLGFKHTTEPPTPPRTLNTTIPLHLEQAILKALAKNRHDRFAHIAAFLAALEQPEPTIQIQPADSVYPVAASPKDDPAFKAGEHLYAEEEYAEALQAFAQVLSRHPRFPDAWIGKGKTLQELERYEEALNAFDKALLFDPEHASAWFHKGLLFAELKRFEEAVHAYNAALRLHPSDALCWYHKANALFYMDRFEEALRSAEEALRFNPDHALSWNTRGSVLYCLQRYEEAIAAYEEAIRLKPSYSYAWNGKGQALNKLGRYEAALQAYEEAIRLKPSYTYAWNGKGEVLFSLNRYEEALQACAETLRLDPAQASIWNIKGDAFLALERYEEALQAYNETLRLDPRNATVWHRKGLLLLNLQRYEEALQAYNETLRLDPQNATVWQQKGLFLLKLRQYGEALQAYNEALRLNPHAASAWYQKGLLFVQINRIEEAKTAFEQALQLQPDHVNARMSLDALLS